MNESRWRCPTCGAVVTTGNAAKCPECGTIFNENNKLVFEYVCFKKM